MAEQFIPIYDPQLSTSRSSSVAYEASRVIKATPGVLFGLSGYSSNVAAQFIQIHDASSLPANGVAPLAFITVPASSNFSIDFGVFGIPCFVGIVVCNSTTGPTKTIGAADCYFTVRMR